MNSMHIFLLFCQIQGGEFSHCSPPQGVMQKLTPTWTQPGPVWQMEWPTWESCVAEAKRKNTIKHPDKYGGGEGWAFFCYAKTPDIRILSVRPAPEFWRRASDGE